jgi:hypothetical protein
MRTVISALLDNHRIREGKLASDSSYGLQGAFQISGPHGRDLAIISGIGEGWEHVSVSLKTRTPNWQEMCFVKDLFWTEDEVVMQLHPAKTEYVNYHQYCLHLWKPIEATIPTPPSILVGPR